MTRPDSSMRPARLSPRTGQVGLGAWLALAAVWPAVIVPVGRSQVLWQPVLLATIALLAIRQRTQHGWFRTAGESVWLYAIYTIAGWLPLLHATEITGYPPAYGAYLAGYEAGIAGLIGYYALRSLIRTAGSAGEPLTRVMAAPLLLIRALQAGHWVVALAGLLLGGLVAATRPWRRLSSSSRDRVFRVLPWVLFFGGAVLVFGSAMRIYTAAGPERFLLASDDGQTYYQMALTMSKQPGLFWTAQLVDQNFFSAYYPAMALWFMAVGPHLPSWFLFHALAGGVLVVTVYALGRKLGGRAVGVWAAGLTLADHVILQLMATMNMETFFVPLLFLGLLLWCDAGSPAAKNAALRSWWAGIVMGVATWFRPTSALLPFFLVGLTALERRPAEAGTPPPAGSARDESKGAADRSGGLRSRQAAALLGGFAVAMAGLFIRHRIAWGYWTLGGLKTKVCWLANGALSIGGEHPADIGVWPWLQLVAQHPEQLWTHMIPGWWKQLLYLWTHRGFGRMDLVQGLNDAGAYQAALMSVMTVAFIAGAGLALRRRTRTDLALLALPVYFSVLVLVFFVLNSRYRAPFLPVLYLLACLGFYAVRSGKFGVRGVSHDFEPRTSNFELMESLREGSPGNEKEPAWR